jgi:hypothetical protein
MRVQLLLALATLLPLHPMQAKYDIIPQPRQE